MKLYLQFWSEMEHEDLNDLSPKLDTLKYLHSFPLLFP